MQTNYCKSPLSIKQISRLDFAAYQLLNRCIMLINVDIPVLLHCHCGFALLHQCNCTCLTFCHRINLLTQFDAHLLQPFETETMLSAPLEIQTLNHGYWSSQSKCGKAVKRVRHARLSSLLIFRFVDRRFFIRNLHNCRTL